MPLNYSNTDVVSALKSCPNINAALKNLLKKDIQANKELARVVKDLRDICQAPKNEQRLEAFVDRHIKKYPHIFQAVVRYGHFDKIDAITAPAIEQHAEQFNATYQNQEQSITITDRKRFDSIASQVISDFRKQLTGQQLPSDDFMLSVLITTLFDPQVVPEIEALVQAN